MLSAANPPIHRLISSRQFSQDEVLESLSRYLDQAQNTAYLQPDAQITVRGVESSNRGRNSISQVVFGNLRRIEAGLRGEVLTGNPLIQLDEGNETISLLASASNGTSGPGAGHESNGGTGSEWQSKDSYEKSQQEVIGDYENQAAVSPMDGGRAPPIHLEEYVDTIVHLEDGHYELDSTTATTKSKKRADPQPIDPALQMKQETLLAERQADDSNPQGYTREQLRAQKRALKEARRAGKHTGSQELPEALPEAVKGLIKSSAVAGRDREGRGSEEKARLVRSDVQEAAAQRTSVLRAPDEGGASMKLENPDLHDVTAEHDMNDQRRPLTTAEKKARKEAKKRRNSLAPHRTENDHRGKDTKASSEPVQPNSSRPVVDQAQSQKRKHEDGGDDASQASVKRLPATWQPDVPETPTKRPHESTSQSAKSSREATRLSLAKVPSSQPSVDHRLSARKPGKALPATDRNKDGDSPKIKKESRDATDEYEKEKLVGGSQAAGWESPPDSGTQSPSERKRDGSARRPKTYARSRGL